MRMMDLSCHRLSALLHALSPQTQQVLFLSANFGVQFKHIPALDVRSRVQLLISATQKRKRSATSGKSLKPTWRRLVPSQPPTLTAYLVSYVRTQTILQVQTPSVICGAKSNRTTTHVATSVLVST